MSSPAAIRPSIGAAIHSVRRSAAAAAAASSNASMPLPARIATPATSSILSANPSRIHAASLSTTASLLKRHKYPGARNNRDNSKHRGESAIRRTGPRWRLSVSDEPLPQPVKPDQLPRVETDPNHGLWEFFADRKTVAAPPEEDAKHGRAWLVEELRVKSWDDLHRLWWVCVKERNRIATASWERKRSNLGFGQAEAKARDDEVKKTMRGIKHVLTERQYAWEDAVKLAETDPEIDLSAKGPVFTPSRYLEEADEVLEDTASVEAEVAAEESTDNAGAGAKPLKTEASPAAQAISPETNPQNEASKL